MVTAVMKLTKWEISSPSTLTDITYLYDHNY
jgi:hypothetical protein